MNGSQLASYAKWGTAASKDPIEAADEHATQEAEQAIVAAPIGNVTQDYPSQTDKAKADDGPTEMKFHDDDLVELQVPRAAWPQGALPFFDADKAGGKPFSCFSPGWKTVGTVAAAWRVAKEPDHQRIEVLSEEEPAHQDAPAVFIFQEAQSP
ncbi:hypothetical protein AK812_SmicGene35044 [Symbiodinium microadriaticum]|uniref:Uncharacterized protein n=1 Tax=Symbiodinium microadriaticum TaxID=2951 RepID=A0A1Q9CMF9_SYMMI|nr:hypothetical protein AK812_SmicGene35044 [Symbiodinium microadriaticum]